MDQKVDLFGNPDRPGRGMKGRPPFEVTEKDRNKVKLLLALGWSNDRIANALAVSLATLKRYFRAELTVRDKMRDRLDAERLAVAAEAAMTGNPSALRVFDQMVDKNDMRLKVARLGDGGMQPQPSGPAPALGAGKKEMKKGDAAKAIAADPDLFATSRPKRMN